MGIQILIQKLISALALGITFQKPIKLNSPTIPKLS